MVNCEYLMEFMCNTQKQIKVNLCYYRQLQVFYVQTGALGE